MRGFRNRDNLFLRTWEHDSVSERQLTTPNSIYTHTSHQCQFVQPAKCRFKVAHEMRTLLSLMVVLG